MPLDAAGAQSTGTQAISPLHQQGAPSVTPRGGQLTSCGRCAPLTPREFCGGCPRAAGSPLSARGVWVSSMGAMPELTRSRTQHTNASEILFLKPLLLHPTSRGARSGNSAMSNSTLVAARCKTPRTVFKGAPNTALVRRTWGRGASPAGKRLAACDKEIIMDRATAN